MKIKALYRQDLMSVAGELPKIPHMDHEKLILDSYRNGGWLSVGDYVLFVHQLHREMNPVEPVVAKIIRLLGKCLSLVRKSIVWLVNIFKRTRYVGVVTGVDAERFLWNMNNPRKVSKEEVERINGAGKNFRKIMKKAKI